MQEYKCEKCSSIPQQYVFLDCNHAYCLNCLSKQYQEKDNKVQCYICYQITQLDTETINALQETKYQYFYPLKISPCQTNKKSLSQKEIHILKSHPFLEKINVVIEKHYDYIRNSQFERQKTKEFFNNQKIELEFDFQNLNKLLQEKYNALTLQMQELEKNFLQNLQIKEDQYQIEIKQNELLKEEIKYKLHHNKEISTDIEQFKIMLNEIEQIIQNHPPNFQSQLNVIQGQTIKIQNQSKEFVSNFQQFLKNFDIKQEQTQQNSQFITQTRLDRIQSSLSNTISSTNVKPMRNSNASIIPINSPQRNSYLNDDLQQLRKSSRMELMKASSPKESRINLINKRSTKSLIPTLNLTGISFIK